jgi:hypothetical protein
LGLNLQRKKNHKYTTIRQCINYTVEILSLNSVGIDQDSGDIFFIDLCVKKYATPTGKFWNNMRKANNAHLNSY